MKCLECHQELERLDNDHLLQCCGLTLQEYAIKRHMPLDVLLTQDQINQSDPCEDYPELRKPIGEHPGAILTGIELIGLLTEAGELSCIEGDIKRLDLLLWHLQHLSEVGFRFRQEYVYHNGSHRVLSLNRLKVRSSNLDGLRTSPALDAPNLLDSLATAIAFAGKLHAEYLFFPVAEKQVAVRLVHRLQKHHGIAMVLLEAFASPEAALLRCQTLQDSQRLLALLESRLLQMPGCRECFYEKGLEATVVKELVFDSAHFISDHPGKCSNLHGGHYRIQVKVKDRIDPATGFVLDYGYLKNVVKRLVINRLDHQSLNYVDARLAWRSSTEFLCVFIWEQLIDYLPGLIELQIHETEHSYCCYRGPSLAAFQTQGENRLLNHFTNPSLGRSQVRQQLVKGKNASLRVAARNR